MKKFKKDYSAFRAGVQRYEIAMKGVPDRVPIYAQIHDFARKESGMTGREFYSNPENLVRGSLETMEKWGIDFPFLDYDVYNIEPEALGQKIIYSNDGIPDIDRLNPLIQEKKDLSKIKTPDFNSNGRFPQVVAMYSLYRELTGIEPTLNFSAPFTMAANIRGIEQLIMDIWMEPDFVCELMTRITDEVIAPWILFLKKSFPGSKAICGSDATSSLPIVNMDILKNWSLPYILRLREHCGPEVYVPNWVGERYLKNPEEMFALKSQVCPYFLEGQDPDVAEIGPVIYKDYADKRGIPLVLGIGASFIALSTPEEIAKRVKHYIEVGGKNGRFCLYLCSVDSSTPSDNLKAVMDAIRTFGPYKK